MAEQTALDFSQGQHAFDTPVPFGQEEMGTVPESLLGDPLPAEAMKEGGFRQVQDEGVPGCRIPCPRGPYVQAHR
jgi:hypothetical protein